MTISADRIAGAPITWGVCEVPEWGVQLPADRVLQEMRSLGLRATELGPVGFLPRDPPGLRRALGPLGLVGAFIPIVAHEPEHVAESLESVAREAGTTVALGGSVVVLACVSGAVGYDHRPRLDARALATTASTLERAVAVAAEAGIRCALHPHTGTLVETVEEIAAVLAESSIPLCLDTGHLVVGGADPLEIARSYGSRVSHVHLKDVDLSLASRVRSRKLSYSDAVAAGIWRALGEGGVPVHRVVDELEAAGYDGWYVLEQDVMLSETPLPDTGPARDAARSIDYLSDARSAEATPSVAGAKGTGNH